MPTKSATATAAPPKATKKDSKESGADRLDRFRKKLLAKQAELIEDLHKNRQISDETIDESAQDMADRATSAYTKEFAYSLSESDRKTLILIEEALKRMDAGTYGVCVGSGQPIEEKRLEAVPWARYSLEFQEMADKGLL
ncbi:MAG: TraR/DksA family transcriptional regulator [Acidobacteria bacterium]|nr:TraR/DksA family transcriptional regulator [Acidobacteriota bacterium]